MQLSKLKSVRCFDIDIIYDLSVNDGEIGVIDEKGAVK
jgi:hypothetical protein